MCHRPVEKANVLVDIAAPKFILVNILFLGICDGMYKADASQEKPSPFRRIAVTFTIHIIYVN